jgi:hypothetical protein
MSTLIVDKTLAELSTNSKAFALLDELFTQLLIAQGPVEFDLFYKLIRVSFQKEVAFCVPFAEERNIVLLWNKLWGFYKKHDLGENVINRFIKENDFSKAVADEIIDYLDPCNETVFMWWMAIYAQIGPCRRNSITADYCKERPRAYLFLSMSFNLRDALSSLETCVYPQESWWEDVWWQQLNVCWRRDKTSTEQFLVNMDIAWNSTKWHTLQKALKNRGVEQSKEFMVALLQGNEAIMCEQWLRLSEQGLDEIPMVIYMHLESIDHRIMIDKVEQPTREMISYLLLRYEYGLAPELKVWVIKWLREKTPKLSTNEVMRFVSRRCSDLVSTNNIEDQVEVAKRLVSRDVWDFKTFNFLKRLTDSGAQFTVLSYIWDNRCSQLQAVREAFGLLDEDVGFSLARLSTGMPIHLSYLRAHLAASRCKKPGKVHPVSSLSATNMPTDDNDFYLNGVGFHKFMLSRYSDLFHEMFNCCSSSETCLELPFEVSVVQHFWKFIYKGELPDKSYYESHRLADFLGARAWKQQLLLAGQNSLCMKTVPELLRIYQETGNEDVRNSLIDYICSSTNGNLPVDLCQELMSLTQ